MNHTNTTRLKKSDSVLLYSGLIVIIVLLFFLFRQTIIEKFIVFSIKYPSKSVQSNLRDYLIQNRSNPLVLKALFKLCSDKDYHVQAHAENILSYYDKNTTLEPAYINGLTRQIEEGDPSTAMICIRIVSDRKIDQAIPALIVALKRKDFNLKISALAALGIIGPERALEPILDVIESDPKLRKTAIMIVSGIKDKRVSKAMRICLRDKSPKVRKITIAVSSVYEDKSNIDVILKLLYDKDESVRIMACKYFGSINELKYIEALRNKNNDVSPKVRLQAIKEINKIRDWDASRKRL